MLSYITLGLLALSIAYVAQTYRCYAINLAAAKQSGIPYFCKSYQTS